MEGLSPIEKFNIITRDIPRGEAEEDYVIGEDDIKKILETRDLNLYWGTATTGSPHIGYFVPIMKIGDFLRAGCNVTILFADLHGFLDNNKSTWELLHHRCLWYESVIKAMLRRVNVPIDRLRFVKGTSYQLRDNYTLDVYKLSSLVTTAHAIHAGTEVVKQLVAPKLSNMLYPILQSLDEEYLGCDVQFGGVDQRKIFMFSREWMPKIGYRKRSYVMNPLIPGLGKSGKMSSSEKLSKIDFHDTPDMIREKISMAYSIDGRSLGNGMLALLQFVLFRYLSDMNRPFICNGVEYTSYTVVEMAFAEQRITSRYLKESIAELLIEFLAPLRQFYIDNEGLYKLAYPEEVAAAAEKQPGGLIGIRLESMTIMSINPHPNARLSVVELRNAKNQQYTGIIDGAALASVVIKDNIVVVNNCAEKMVKGVNTTTQIVSVSSFSNDAGRSVCVIKCEEIGPLTFGPADEPSDEIQTLGSTSKALKGLSVRGGSLFFLKKFESIPQVQITVEGGNVGI